MLAARAASDGVSPEEIERRLAVNISIGRIVDMAEVADVVTFLASPRSIAINGDAIACGGGARGDRYIIEPEKPAPGHLLQLALGYRPLASSPGARRRRPVHRSTSGQKPTPRADPRAWSGQIQCYRCRDASRGRRLSAEPGKKFVAGIRGRDTAAVVQHLMSGSRNGRRIPVDAQVSVPQLLRANILAIWGSTNEDLYRSSPHQGRQAFLCHRRCQLLREEGQDHRAVSRDCSLGFDARVSFVWQYPRLAGTSSISKMPPYEPANDATRWRSPAPLPRGSLPGHVARPLARRLRATPPPPPPPPLLLLFFFFFFLCVPNAAP